MAFTLKPVLVIIQLTLLIGLSLSQSQPIHCDLQGCECRHRTLICRNTDFSHVRQLDIPTNITNVRIIWDLQTNTVYVITIIFKFIFFVNLPLKFECMWCKNVTIYSNFFPQKIQIIGLYRTQIADIKPFAFANATKRRFIGLYALELDSIQPFAFAKLPSRTSLTFFLAHIKGPIHTNAFANIDASELSFINSFISSIESNAIWGHVSDLDFVRNSIGHIKTNAIDKCNRPYGDWIMAFTANNITKLDSSYFTMHSPVNQSSTKTWF